MSYYTIFFGSKLYFSQNASTQGLFLNQISIATTSITLHLMSRSRTALVHLNISFLETLAILILRINHHACIGISSCIPAESALVSYSNASLWQWTGYYLQTDTDVRYESLTPTGTRGAAWMKLSIEPDSVQPCPIYSDAHRSLWKQLANLDFPFSHGARTPRHVWGVVKRLEMCMCF